MSDIDKVTISKNKGNHQQAAQVDMRTIVQDMLDLKEILVSETMWLRMAQIDKVKRIHDEKLRLIRRLEIQKELVKNDPSILGGGTQEERQYLKNLQVEMDQIVKDNFTETLKAREINKRIVDTISKAVGQYNTKATGYNDRGVGYSNGEIPPTVDSAYAVTINETI